MTKDSVIVLSGGLDSTTMLYDYASRIALAITFDYGSNHNAREIDCARKSCKKLGIEHLVIPLDFMGKYFQSSLLSGAEAIPTGDYSEENMKSTVVPFRNGIMLSVACGMAESRGLKYVMIANHGGDHSIYPDCRPAFIKSMSEAMQHGTYDHIEISAPYTDISKTEIVGIAASKGVDFSLTYSCYKGGEQHCGQCGTCIERRTAFKEAGIPDPTIYKE